MRLIRHVVNRLKAVFYPYDPATDPRTRKLIEDIRATGRTDVALEIIQHWLDHPEDFERDVKEHQRIKS